MKLIFRSKYYLLRLFVIFLVTIQYTGFCLAQDANYIDTNDEYVDAVGPGEVQNERSPLVSRASWNQNDQINTGVLNYGLSESVYYQFSGEDIFKDGKTINGELGFNWSWSHLNKLDYPIPAAWSYGSEFQYFKSTSESTYSGSGSVDGSSIDMNLYMLSVALKAFFLDPVAKFVQPYLGVGWGLLAGDFKTVQNITGSKYTTNFNGALNYQIIGVQIMLMERIGLMAEIKNMRATASTSNDPFDRASGDSVDLKLDGVIIGLTGFFRF